MLWPREEFHAAYGQIKHDALQTGGSSVLVLVALDVDALCASAILTSLFKADFVSYALLPVRGYEDIVRIRDARIATPSGASELRSIVMINCGAIVNIAQLLQLPRAVKCYVFDSHRPIHLANIYDANQQIVVFDDGAQAIDEFPEDGSDIERDEFDGETEGEDDDDEEEEEEDEEEGEDAEVDEDEGEAEVEFGAPTEHTEDTEESEVAVGNEEAEGLGEKKKKRKRDVDGGEDGEGDDDPVDDDNDSDDDVEMASPKKHKSEGEGVHVEVQEITEDTVDVKMAKRHRREQILRYYRGSFHGAPAASIAFELAQQMNAGSNRDLLWFAIVGLTKQFIMEEIDADNYTLMVHRFQDEVLALDASAAGGGGGLEDDQTIANPAYEHGRISFEEEYRFMCYRHWSLYEAMYYSDYVAAKLGLYMDQARRFGARNAASADGNDGETTLHVFLARMGFSLRQSQQKFTYMPLEMKHQLRDKIQEIAPEFGLDDVFYGSFKRQFAFQYLLGAADAVHGLHALLEAPEAYISSVFQAENHHQKGALQQSVNSAFTIDSAGITPASTSDSGADDGEKGEDLRDFKHQNFFLASTALTCRSVASSALMESGIKVAMELKQAIVRVGISIMERKLIVRVKHFRYVCLTIPEREQELFANPNVLTQLALFLLTVHRASGKWGSLPPPKKKKTSADGDDDGDDQDEEPTQQKPIVPLVLITRNPAQNCFLVVGITCPTNPGEVHRKYVVVQITLMSIHGWLGSRIVFISHLLQHARHGVPTRGRRNWRQLSSRWVFECSAGDTDGRYPVFCRAVAQCHGRIKDHLEMNQVLYRETDCWKLIFGCDGECIGAIWIILNRTRR
jgi:cell division control protein 45